MDQLQSPGQEKAASAPSSHSPVVLGQPAHSQVIRLFHLCTCALPNCPIAVQLNERWPGLSMDHCHPQVSRGPPESRDPSVHSGHFSDCPQALPFPTAYRMIGFQDWGQDKETWQMRPV